RRERHDREEPVQAEILLSAGSTTRRKTRGYAAGSVARCRVTGRSTSPQHRTAQRRSGLITARSDERGASPPWRLRIEPRLSPPTPRLRPPTRSRCAARPGEAAA